MERRDFLKMAGAAGLTVGAASMYPKARAGLAGPVGNQTNNYEGPLFAFFQAIGGWDPTFLCDPKGNELNQSYGEGEILVANGIPYAPIPGATEFFTAHAHHMTVINALDVQTNAHDAGRRNMTSGRLGEGYPNIAALIAGAGATGLPMAFLTFGGYEETRGTVSPTRDGNQSRLTELAHPDQINAGDMENPQYFMSSAARDILEAAKEERALALVERQKLPRFSASMNTLLVARESSDQLALLEEYLPEPDPNMDFRRIQLAVAAYKAGVGAAANFALDGFDTHSNHDAAHIPRMTEIVGMVRFLFEEAERQGVADRIVATMASDFGRTPGYNGGNGKDHWPISSMIVVGQDIPSRVVGVSDMGHNPIPLDPATLLPAENPDAGVFVQPVHVHRSLRKKFGVAGTVFDNLFPLPTDTEIDIFA